MLVLGTSKQHEEPLAGTTAQASRRSHGWSMAQEAALKWVLGSSGASTAGKRFFGPVLQRSRNLLVAGALARLHLVPQKRL